MSIGDSVDYIFLVDTFLSTDFGKTPYRQERVVCTYFKYERGECEDKSRYNLYLFHFRYKIQRR